MLFNHPVLLLISLYEGVPDLASVYVHLAAHAIRIACHAVLPLQEALVGWLVFYQPFCYQFVPRCLKNAQGKALDATLEKAPLFSTRPGKIGLLLEN